MTVFSRLTTPLTLVLLLAINAGWSQVHTVPNIVSQPIYNPFPTDSIFYCGMDSVLLDAGAGFTSYKWNTGDTTRSIKAAWSDQFYVNAVNSLGDTLSDTVFVSVLRYSIDGYIIQNTPYKSNVDSTNSQTTSVSLQYTFNRETILNNNKGSIWVADEDCVIDSLSFSIQRYYPTGSEPCYGTVTVHEMAGNPLTGIANLKGTYYWSVKNTGLVTLPVQLFFVKGKTYRFTFIKGPQTTQSFFGNTAYLRTGVIPGFSNQINGNTQTITSLSNGVWIQLRGKKATYQGNTRVYNSCFTNPVSINVNGSYLNYAWSTGLLLPNITFVPKSDSTIYLDIKNEYHTCTDSVVIKVFNTAFSPFTKDSLFACALKQVSLTAGNAAYSKYTWSPGNQTTDNIVADADGWYKVSATGGQNCTVSDSIYVTLEGSITKVYRFTGDGLYSNSNNWDKKNGKPPTAIGPREAIEISPSGECIMDVPQVINGCSSFSVKKKGMLIRNSQLLIKQ
jgi:hypothetical protein